MLRANTEKTQAHCNTDLSSVFATVLKAQLMITCTVANRWVCKYFNMFWVPEVGNTIDGKPMHVLHYALIHGLVSVGFENGFTINDC